MNRRQGALMAVAAAATLSLLVSTTSAGADAPPVKEAERAAAPAAPIASFGDPETEDRPLMRWWMPLAPIEESELRRQLEDVQRAGFGGVEIGAFPVNGADTAEHGWDSDAWNESMASAVEIADELDLAVDFMVSANYPMATPATYVDPDTPGSEKELAWGATVVEPGETFSAPAPSPIEPAAAGVDEETLQSVVVAQLEPGQDVAGANLGRRDYTTLHLDPDTIQVLDVPAGPGGDVDFTAPAGGEDWILTSYWLRGSGASVADITTPTSYVVDHLSEVGTQAWIDLWEDELLADPATAALLEENGGAFFEDSLHLSSYQLWTDDLLEEFEERRGYDLTPYLPALLQPEINNYFGADGYDADRSLATFEFGENNDLGQRVRNDYFETMTELYVERHLEPMRDWTASRGMEIRIQPSYGQTLEQSQAVFAADIPETEGFQHGYAVDAYRSIAAAAHASDKPVISTECCANFGQANAFGWQQTLEDVEASYAGGLNQVVFHGYSYDRSPNATWPGWVRFGQNGFSENYGRQPSWELVRNVSDYMARQQTVLRQGRQQTDVAIYRHSYWEMDHTRPSQYFDSGSLSADGFSYGFVSPEMLALDDFTYADGALDAEGAAYRAMVLDDQATLPVDAVDRLLAAAEDGMPVVIAGRLPSKSPFQSERGQDEHISDAVAQLVELDNVRRVGTADDVAGALDELGVAPAAAPNRRTPLLSVHRTDEAGEYYHLYNPSGETVTRTYRLEGAGVPHVLDAWTGETSHVAEYRRVDGGVKVEVTLEPQETTILGIAAADGAAGSDLDRGVHVTRTAHTAVYDESGSLALRLTDEEEATAVSSIGREVTVSATPPAVSLGDRWRLRVESWEQASGDDPYAIDKVVHHRTLDVTDGELPSWQELPGLEDVSGVGAYRTTVEVGEDWNSRSGALLDLGAAFDTVTVSVNGEEIGVDRGNPVVDLSEHLRIGDNALVVRVGTTLRNRMRVVSGSAATPSTRPRQDYGVFGPVSLTAYEDVPISGLARSSVKAPAWVVGKRTKAIRVPVRVLSRRGDTEGTVVLSKGQRRLDSAKVRPNGKAVLRIPRRSLRVGIHRVRVSFSGNGTTAPSADHVRVRVRR